MTQRRIGNNRQYESEGVRALYDDQSKRIELYAWCDGNFRAGLQVFDLAEFLTGLGITYEDCRSALGAATDE